MLSFKIFHQDPALSLYKLLFHYFICLTNTSPGKASVGTEEGVVRSRHRVPACGIQNLHTYPVNACAMTCGFPMQRLSSWHGRLLLSLCWSTEATIVSEAMVLPSFSVICLLQILQHKSIQIPFACFSDSGQSSTLVETPLHLQSDLLLRLSTVSQMLAFFSSNHFSFCDLFICLFVFPKPEDRAFHFRLCCCIPNTGSCQHSRVVSFTFYDSSLFKDACYLWPYRSVLGMGIALSECLWSPWMASVDGRKSYFE